MKSKQQALPRARRPTRKHILFLMGWHAPDTQACIFRHALEANWSVGFQAMRTSMGSNWREIDGIITILGGWERRPELTEFVRQAGVPTVDMHADEAETVPAGRVLMDNVAIGRLAADHFIERDFTKCLFFCRGMEWSAQGRHQGFSARLDEAGIKHTSLECAPRFTTRGVVVRQCARHLKQHLAKVGAPLGLFAGSDEFALIVMEACDLLGVKIPEELALLGCGDQGSLLDFTSTPLSSVTTDAVSRADAAACLLDRLMDGDPVPAEPILIPPLGVTTRHSTDILAVDDTRLAAALSCVRQHFGDVELDPGRVAADSGIPQRTLTRLFRLHLGRTIAEDIRFIRLEKAMHLLSTTSLTASSIAEECGFASLLHFRRNLKRRTGQSPRQWRRSHVKPGT